MKLFKKVLVVLLICFLCVFIGGVYTGKLRGLLFIAQQGEWSIGIYTGESPFTFVPPETIRNPVLTAKYVTDVSAKFVADPFIIKEDSSWYMFFEVLNSKTNHGDIGFATSNDLSNWIYKGIILDEPFHLSYPYIFKFHNAYYMIPESRQANSIRLYEAKNFPREWVFVTSLLDGNYGDVSIFHYKGKWWIMAETNPPKDDTLRLYYTGNLMGPWIEHPKSPIIEGDANIARPGGRVLIVDNKIIRYAQDDYPTYGNQIWAFEITDLTTTNYEEKQVTNFPILQASGKGWNGKGMHTIDAHKIGENKWVASVDGYREYSVLRLGYWFPAWMR